MNNGRSKTKIVLADQVLVSGVNFLTGLLLARYLGLEGYGQYVLAYGLVLFSAGFHVAMIVSPMMVIAPRFNGEHSEKYFANVYVANILFCILSLLSIFVVSNLLSFFFPHWELGSLLWPLCITAPFFLLQDYYRRYFFVIDKPKLSLINDCITYGLRLVFLLAFGFSGLLGAAEAIWIVGGSAAIGVALAVLQNKNLRVYGQLDFDGLKKVVIDHWNFGKWLIANNLTYWGGSQFIIYMVGAILTTAYVGAMSATLNLVGIANVLFLALENIVPSRSSRIYSNSGSKGLSKYLSRISLLGGLATLTIVMIAGVWSEEWLSLIYGEEYLGYGWLVWWWGLYYFVGFFQRPLSAGLRVLGYTKGIFYASIAGSVLALICGYISIQWLQLDGAMLLLCFIQTTILVSMYLYYRNVMGTAAH
ncbi:MAG: lipopolysaccharide biosynthesis protein [Gammaproteobacteria bacterium]